MTAQQSAERSRIFISYGHVEPDQTVVRAVSDALKQHHNVFVDTDIVPGSDWGQEIDEALENADFLIAFLSKRSAGKRMAEDEIRKAHDRRMITGKPIIIPIRLQYEGPLPYPLSAYLNRFQYVVWEGREDTGRLIKQLLEVLAYSPKKRPLLPAQRDRLLTIQRIRHDWIDGYLNNVLGVGSLLDPMVTDAPDKVDCRLELFVHRPYEESRRLLPGKSISTVFDEHLGQLLVLGAPGSGKTVLLLQLARELLHRAEFDSTVPIPVIFHLSTWAKRRHCLADWLVEEMNRLYDIPRQLAKAWAEEGEILPLLDGLDEVAPRHRQACVEAINDFREQHGLVPIVVCSRTEEYETLTTRLRLPGAVEIQPLDVSQAKDFIAAAGEAFMPMRTALESEPTLWHILDTPLMLHVFILAWQGLDRRATGPEFVSPTPREQREEMLGKYIEAMLRSRPNKQQFTREQTVTWLSWLACSMAKTNQSFLYPRGFDLAWMPTSARLPTQSAAVWIAYALYALFIGLRLLLIYGILAWLRVGPIRGFVAGGILGIVESVLRSIAIEVPVWASPVRATIAYGGRLYANRAGTNLAWYMPETLRRLARNGIIFGLLGGLFIGLFSGGLSFGLNGLKILGLIVGLLIGLAIGMLLASARGYEWVQECSLRSRLWRAGLAPWKYVRFLDYATERTFLRRVGDGYVFAHRLVMDYFVAQYQLERT